MTFTQDEIQKLLETVDEYHTKLILDFVGYSVLSTEDEKLLKELGVKIDEDDLSAIDKNYAFGAITAIFNERGLDRVVKDMTAPDFEKFIKRTKGIPLSVTEKAALNLVKNQAYKDIKKLANTVKEDIYQLYVDGDYNSYSNIESKDITQEEYEKLLEDKATETILRRETASYMARNLGKETKDWARDFDRVSDYVLQTAYQNGMAETFERLTGDDDSVMYYKNVFAGACKHCIRIYLTNGIGSKPKLFTYEELVSNGTNIGRKAQDWRPVIGAVHPFCRCQLNTVDTDIYKWDDKRNDWVVKQKDKGKTKEVKPLYGIDITFNGKKYEI